MASLAPLQVKRAGIVVIGDEILKGQTQDTNTFFLAQNLRKLGVSLERVTVIPDDLDIIAAEVKNFANNFDFVITSGGIGPTHDDLTFEGVAMAFDRKVEHNPKLVDLCKGWFKTEDMTQPCFKMALIPSQAQLNFGTDKVTGKPILYPIVSVENVFIFPGIPELLQRAFNNLGETLFKTETQFISSEVYFAKDELSLTPRLNQLVKSHSGVTFGSYPVWSNQYFKTKITLEAATEDIIEAAKSEMKEMSPINFDPNPMENSLDKIKEFLEDCNDENLVQVVDHSFKTIEECFTKYEPEKVSVCFNGGKDCIVMLHLVHAYHQKYFPGRKLKSFYISEKKTFSEVDRFMDTTISRYNLHNKVFEGPMKPALAKMLEDDPSVAATILGVRKGDPGSQYMDTFSPTDGDWPKVIRVNPILDWKYNNIWAFLRGLSLPYPSLYDQGYTSLGNPDNTIPNPALSYLTDKGEESFKPAYMLEDSTLERQGRI
eukprot:GFUD01034349.1.p1 GENE.GFUD01034349.1~~GFUD01034349.1.p1  ORF type:complete len:517 (+),score=126.37 GFUD01034349.1:92-1552(+)